MGSYLPLFTVDVKHTFFYKGFCPGLDFVPTPDTLTFIENTGLLVRHTQYGVRVFFDQNSSEALRRYTLEPEEPLRLVFKVFPREKLFRFYTEISTPEEDSLLYFDNQRGKIDSNRRCRLHTAEYVSDRDFETLKSPRIAGILSRKDQLLKPEFMVSIGLGKNEIQFLDKASKNVYLQYFIRFRARETFWKYYLLGSMIKKKSIIADLNHETEFEATGRASLPDDRVALTFRSKQRIPLREKSEYRFQLKEKGTNGGRVLIRRLPVASAGQFYKETVDGKEAIVSEIFINC
jgi:hypothetical protein